LLRSRTRANIWHDPTTKTLILQRVAKIAFGPESRLIPEISTESALGRFSNRRRGLELSHRDLSLRGKGQNGVDRIGLQIDLGYDLRAKWT
jgi:hypothetical protein